MLLCICVVALKFVDILLELCYSLPESSRCYNPQGCDLGIHWQVCSHFFSVKIEDISAVDSVLHNIGDCFPAATVFKFIRMTIECDRNSMVNLISYFLIMLVFMVIAIATAKKQFPWIWYGIGAGIQLRSLVGGALYGGTSALKWIVYALILIVSAVIIVKRDH